MSDSGLGRRALTDDVDVRLTKSKDRGRCLAGIGLKLRRGQALIQSHDQTIISDGIRSTRGSHPHAVELVVAGVDLDRRPPASRRVAHRKPLEPTATAASALIADTPNSASAAWKLRRVLVIGPSGSSSDADPSALTDGKHGSACVRDAVDAIADGKSLFRTSTLRCHPSRRFASDLAVFTAAHSSPPCHPQRRTTPSPVCRTSPVASAVQVAARRQAPGDSPTVQVPFPAKPATP